MYSDVYLMNDKHSRKNIWNVIDANAGHTLLMNAYAVILFSIGRATRAVCSSAYESLVQDWGKIEMGRFQAADQGI
jgi:hypothetical protein